MRYIVAVAAAVVVLFLLSVTTGFGDWPRPWGSLSRGLVGGLVCVGVLMLWEQLAPSPDRDTQADEEPEAGGDSAHAADGEGPESGAPEDR
ncbi:MULTISPECIES: hypothetical protein [Brevibacterium]|jgi:hypothetical protein|uniref:Secreted protein n=1 Tax=Brevibacterium salitolerans TaxID=1403566 RepID=A0ABN2WPC5_9MICO|nr:hypothetical protein [Brevibacterium sp.]